MCILTDELSVVLECGRVEVWVHLSSKVGNNGYLGCLNKGRSRNIPLTIFICVPLYQPNWINFSIVENRLVKGAYLR